ncbi:MAG: ATP-binding protein [Elusimicrobia bacterium]|nr:ATP-binding protein [Elusimicrobiota bacterium]
MLKPGGASESSRPARTKAPSLAEIGAEYIASLGRAIKLAALYRSNHPMAAEAIREAYNLLDLAFATAQQERVDLSLADGRWLVNETPALAETQAPDSIRILFQGHGLRSLSFWRGIKPFELAAMCELAAVPPERAQGAVDDFFVQRGVKHIRHDQERYSRASAKPLPAAPRAAPGPGPGAGAAQPPSAAAPSSKAGLSFGSVLKKLVESAVEDPGERVHLYEDTVRLVKEAMDEHVAQATAALRGEKALTAKVLTSVAEGKVIVDKEGNVLMMNPAAEELAGKSLADMAGKNIMESVSTGENMVAMAKDLGAEPGTNPEVAVSADHEVGRALRRSMAVVEDDSGRVVGTYTGLPDVVKFKETLRLQEEFLSRVTHDLQAPLASINCALELLSERAGATLGPEDNGFLDVCLRNSQQLGSMISEILDFSKLRAGKISIRQAPTSLTGLLKEAVDSLQPWANNKGISLSFRAPSPDLMVMADHQRIVQVLANLISNAIKFTPEGGQIVAAAAAKPDAHGHVICAVKDTGCGISKEGIKKLFEKFSQVGSNDGSQPGVGLGLALVSEFIKLHGGTVWVQSEEGKGSTFYFTLPSEEGERIASA